MVAPPINAQITGLRLSPAARATACAISCTGYNGEGSKMGRTAHTAASSSSKRRLRSYCSGVAEPSTSTGLRRLATGGKKARRAARVASLRSARRSPALSSASAAITPGPPAPVNTATSFPLIGGHHASARAQSSKS